MLQNKLCITLALYTACLFSGCNGDSEHSQAKNFDGYWRYTSQTKTDNCGNDLSASFGAVRITQIADSVTIFPDEASEGISGRVAGNILTWQAPALINSATSNRQGELILNSDGTSAIGKITFEWGYGDYSCTGSQNIEINCHAGLCLQSYSATTLFKDTLGLILRYFKNGEKTK